MKNTDISPPEGFTYVLYQTKNGKQLGLAATEQQFYDKYLIHKKTKIERTNVAQLINKLGHQAANQTLKQFGDQWCTKNGNVFYRPKKEVTT